MWCVEFEFAVPASLPAPEQVAEICRTGYVVEANDAAARMLGRENGLDLLGQSLDGLLPGTEEQRAELLGEFVASGHRIAEREIQVEIAGSQRWIVFSLAGNFEDDGLARIWGIQRDISDRHRLQGQLRQAQKMEAIGRLAGGVAHDFNNLLTAILGYGELLRDGLPGSHELQGDVEQVLSAGRRAKALTTQLLAFSRKQILQPEVLHLNEVIGRFDQMLRRLIGENVRVVLRLEPSLARVQADRVQIEQVIMNLAVNARDAMPQGGTLTIETRNVELTRAYVRAHPMANAGLHVCVALSDTGTGMAPDVQARIFEPFFTTKGKNGTGLGLSTAYGIVQQSGGQISVYSEPAMGTTFKVYLPAIAGESPAIEDVRAKTQPVVGGTETILLVEDDESVRELGRQALVRLGYTVIQASSAEEALAITNQHRGPIHLLLTDIVMPGLPGHALADILVTCRPGLRVLLTSGYAESAVVGTLQRRTTFLQKPYSAGSLGRTVRQVLDRPPVPAAAR